MSPITPEVRQSIESTGHAHLEDPETHDLYVVLKAEAYERLLAQGEPEVREGYSMAMRVFGADGWDDPIMDEYNALDPRRS